MEIEIREFVRPELQQPILITGLPGAGYVAKLAVDHLIKELKAERLSELYSSYLPPQVIIREDGSAEPMKNDFYYWKDPSGRNDIILFTGYSQASTGDAEYKIADKILEYAEAYRVRTVFSFAAYITGSMVSKPKVYGTATDRELLGELVKQGVLVMSEGTITGMNGLLFALAKLRGIKGACLLGETSGYYVDARASQAVLDVLTRLLGLTIDLSPLLQRAQETERIIRTLEEMQRRSAERTGAGQRGGERAQEYIS